MAIRAGAMRHQILIEERSSETDETGERHYVWHERARVRASMEPILGGSEIVASQSRNARVPTRFRIRWIPELEITPAMRIVWNERWFDIKQVLEPDGIQHEIILVAEELVEASTEDEES